MCILLSYCSEKKCNEILLLIVVKIVSFFSPSEDTRHEDDLGNTLEQAVDDKEHAPKPVVKLVFVVFRIKEVLRIGVPVSEEWSQETDSDQISEDSPHELTVKERNHEPAHAYGHEERLNSSEP